MRKPQRALESAFIGSAVFGHADVSNLGVTGRAAGFAANSAANASNDNSISRM
jgi:hypothetical protein